jgi:hypothetical protein
MNIVENNSGCYFCTNSVLCDDVKCIICFEKSFASHPREKSWIYEKNNCSPRDVFIAPTLNTILNVMFVIMKFTSPRHISNKVVGALFVVIDSYAMIMDVHLVLINLLLHFQRLKILLTVHPEPLLRS